MERLLNLRYFFFYVLELVIDRLPYYFSFFPEL